jgi:hypothetical protein
MMHTSLSFANLSDTALLGEVKRLAACEREATARLIASLVELDSRRLYLGEGCSSLFTYCTQVLRLSEHAAYGRIEAARGARRFPILLELLADGSVTLTTVCLLAPHLTPENHRGVLESARHKSKRDVECLVATLRPQPAVSASVRKLPAAATPVVLAVQSEAEVVSQASAVTPASTVTTPPRRPTVVTPLAPALYQIKIAVPQETYDKLRRAQDLLRHTIPSGDPAVVLDRALTSLLSQLEKTRMASTGQPRRARHAVAGSRHIPADIRRKVWARDGSQCAFVGTNGRRCTERGFLEIHHVVPFATGGASELDNVCLRCRAHNAYEAEQYFGSSQPWLVRETRATEYFSHSDSVRPELDAQLSASVGAARASSTGCCRRSAATHIRHDLRREILPRESLTTSENVSP